MYQRICGWQRLHHSRRYFSALIGKVGEVSVVIHKNQAQAISDAIDKLMFTRLNADIAQSFEHLKSKDFIEEFSPKKEEHGNGFHGISFEFKK